GMIKSRRRRQMPTDHDAIIQVLERYFKAKGLAPICCQATKAGPDLQVENPVQKSVEHIEVELDASMSSKVFAGVRLSKNLADTKGFGLRVWFVSSSDKHLIKFVNSKAGVNASWIHAYRLLEPGYLDSLFGFG